MSDWKGIAIDSNLIKYKNDRSVLFKMPKSSEYKYYSFWHPRKLVFNDYWYPNKVSVRYTDNFEFRLKKYGQSRYNSRDFLDEVVLSAAEFEAVFGECGEDYVPLMHEPEALEPVVPTVDKELLDD